MQAVYLNEAPSFAGWKRQLLWLLPVGLVVGLLSWGFRQLDEMKSLPISRVRVQGSFNHLDENSLYAVINKVVNGGYFNVDVDELQRKVESLPWVKQASVRRLWPDTLVVYVVEHQAFAYWGNKSLISNDGVIFTPTEMSTAFSIPHMTGEESLRIRMLDEYRELQGYSQQMGMNITHFEMNDRHSVSLVLSSGIKISVGELNTIARYQRFLRVYDKLLRQRAVDIVNVDLRYSNGMAIRWREHARPGKGV